ncbi:glycosyltransferase family 32 protein [Megasphaera elsdenii]|uniref:glycosyltransferase family 32 protein n=1 Tax=Megasphaera elsdenii TaxID=907 RepID=UPI001474BD19|nr:glycosyltransferase [Megasphaera elsdenii]NME19166.1 glycosyl transferase [Megasphaera elsdenii]
MIPKIIHYCWFGGNSLPLNYQSYMESWKKNLPDYEIKCWNEDNFDVTQNLYCKEAYEHKKWAFVSDYARLKVIYDYGGIYLDTDVEVVKDLITLITNGVGYIGFQNSEEVNTGLGFAAAPHNLCIKSMLDIYSQRKFILDNGEYNLIPCPAANTVGLMKCGLKTGQKTSRTIQHLDGLDVYPEEYFNPLNADTKKLTISNKTYTIHWYTASWVRNSAKKKQILKKFIPTSILEYRTNWIARRDIRKIFYEISYKE